MRARRRDVVAPTKCAITLRDLLTLSWAFGTVMVFQRAYPILNQRKRISA
jgi:hypothetical protein